MSATAIENIFSATPRLVREYLVEDVLPAGLVPFISGSPGIGKSEIVRGIANEFKLKLIDHRLSTSTPEDLSGLPRFTEDGKATFAPFTEMFPTDDMPIPEGYQGWLLFLDEFNSASKAVQAAAYKLVLDKAVGQRRLHPKVAIVCAGNKTSDRAIVNNLSTAMQSRLIHINMVLSHKEWMEDVAYKRNYDSRIIAYLNYKPNNLSDFTPDHNNDTYTCPRTWSFMNDLIKGKEFSTQKNAEGIEFYEMDRKASLYAGTITPSVATDFITYTKVFQNLPSVGTIIANPQGAPIPSDTGSRFAVISHLVEKAEDNNFEKITEYISRFESSMRVLFFRGLIAQKPNLKGHPSFRSSLGDIIRYIYD